MVTGGKKGQKFDIPFILYDRLIANMKKSTTNLTFDVS